MLGEVLRSCGVAFSDIRNENLQSKYESEIFLPFGRIETTEMHVVAQSNLDTAAVASVVGGVLADLSIRSS